MPDGPGEAADRFRTLDDYRVQREWDRYEGTAQRDLFRELRNRFLARHRGAPGPVADLGSGPGRFADALGPGSSPRVLVDVAQQALVQARGRARRIRRSRAAWGLVRGDARRPPLRSGRFGTVALLGNVVGFAEADAEMTVTAAAGLLAPGGTLILEYVAGPGEHSAYLRRLPATAAARALRGPTAWLLARVRSEGFVAEPARKAPGTGSFQRLTPETLDRWFVALGLEVLERMAVAPALGAEPGRLEPARADPGSWAGLLSLEESLGRETARQRVAAAVLVAARRGLGTAAPKIAEP